MCSSILSPILLQVFHSSPCLPFFPMPYLPLLLPMISAVFSACFPLSLFHPLYLSTEYQDCELETEHHPDKLTKIINSPDLWFYICECMYKYEMIIVSVIWHFIYIFNVLELMEYLGRVNDERWLAEYQTDQYAQFLSLLK